MFFWARITLLVNLNVDQCCIAFPAVFWSVARLHEVTGGTQGITLDNHVPTTGWILPGNGNHKTYA